jgi:hypothetical protein
MKTKEFFLLLLIITAGVVFTHIYLEKWDVTFGWEEEWFWDAEEFTYEETEILEPPFPSSLQIINSYGDIVIKGAEQDNIQIQFTKRIRRRDEERAREIADRLDMVIERDPDQVILSTNRQEVRRSKMGTDFTLTVPAGMDVLVKNRYGDVKVSRLGTAELIARNGKVVAWDIAKKLTIWNSYEDVEADNVGLGCHVDSRNSDIKLSRIKGDTWIDQRHGSIDLEDLGGRLDIDAPHSQIYAKGITGPLGIENSYAKITLIEVGPCIITGNNSPVTINGARENVEVYDRYSQVRLENIQGDVRVEGRDLNITGRGIQAEQIALSSSYKDIVLEDFVGETTITLDNGKVTLSPAPLTHALEVKGTYAAVRLVWPSDIMYPIEAQTKGGDIHWKLPVDPAMNVNNGVSILKAFLEQPYPAIRISTSHADIIIDKPIS